MGSACCATSRRFAKDREKHRDARRECDPRHRDEPPVGLLDDGRADVNDGRLIDDGGAYVYDDGLNDRLRRRHEESVREEAVVVIVHPA